MQTSERGHHHRNGERRKPLSLFWRKKQGNEKSGLLMTPLHKILTRGGKGRAYGEVADEVGIGSHETYRKLKSVMKAAEDGDETAQEQVVELESGDQSIHGAYTKVRDAQKEEREDDEQEEEEKSDPDTSDEDEEESSEEEQDVPEQDVEKTPEQTQEEVEETTTKSDESEKTTETETTRTEESPTKTPWDDETSPSVSSSDSIFRFGLFYSPTTSLIDFAISFLCSLFPHSPQMN